jgi:hypothetical protein
MAEAGEALGEASDFVETQHDGELGLTAGAALSAARIVVRFGRRNCTQSCPIREDGMRRIRLSTLMLLIVIAALVVALVMERNRSARLERQIPSYKSYMKAAAKPGSERPLSVGIPKPKEENER